MTVHPLFSLSRNTPVLQNLSLASRDIRILPSISTLQDLYGSDYFPVSISIAKTSPSTHRFSNKLNLSDKQLISLHSRLILEASKFNSLIFSSSTPLNPLQKYETFCFFLSDIIFSFLPRGVSEEKARSMYKIAHSLVERHMC